MTDKETKGEGTYNVLVIGGGTAGLVTAAGTAGLGGRVPLIEAHKMGGDCLNYGCVPSKALISSAKLIHHIRRSEEFGLDSMEPQFSFEAVFERMRQRRARDRAPRFQGEVRRARRRCLPRQSQVPITPRNRSWWRS